jgi:hypothetical protein
VLRSPPSRQQLSEPGPVRRVDPVPQVFQSMSCIEQGDAQASMLLVLLSSGSLARNPYELVFNYLFGDDGQHPDVCMLTIDMYSSNIRARTIGISSQ